MLIQPWLGQVGAPGHGSYPAYVSQLNLSNGVDSGAPLLSTKVTLTSAQILAIHTTPINLVGAQGANTYIELIGLVAKLDFNTTAYSASTNTLQILYTNGSGATVATALPNAFLTSASTAAYKTVPSAVTPVANSPIVATVAANPTLGDSTITLDVFYRVVTIS